MFQSVLRRVTGASPRTQKAYEQLVRDTHDGKPVPANVDEILNGRSAQDFQEDVRVYGERISAATSLENLSELQAAAAAAQKRVSEAKAAVEAHPLKRMIAELQQLEREVESAQLSASSASAVVASKRGEAESLLFQTASQSVFAETREIENQIAQLANVDAEKVRFTADERHARAAAEKAVATLPEEIARASGVDAAMLTAKLTKAKSLLKEYAARDKELTRIEKAIAKLEAQKTTIGQKRHDPSCMQFASVPRPVEL